MSASNERGRPKPPAPVWFAMSRHLAAAAATAPAASQHSSAGPLGAAAQHVAFATTAFAAPAAQHSDLADAFAAVGAALQHTSHESQQVRQSVTHAGHGVVQQTGVSAAAVGQHPPDFASGHVNESVWRK